MLLRPSGTIPAVFSAMSFLIQFALERFFRRFARLSRIPLLPWLGMMTWAAFGVQAAIIGDWVFITGRLRRRQSLVSIAERSAPRPLDRREAPAQLVLTSGRSIPVWVDPARLAEFLAIPLHRV